MASPLVINTQEENVVRCVPIMLNTKAGPNDKGKQTEWYDVTRDEEVCLYQSYNRKLFSKNILTSNAVVSKK